MSPLVNRLLAVLRSPVVRWAFLLGAVALAVVAVAASWDELVAAYHRMPGGHLAGAAAAGAAYVWCTFLSWRVLLAELGSPLPVRAAVSVFGISQLGKYVPGGVWNVVAAAEIGADHKVPRARSLAAIATAMLVGLVSGAVVAAVCLPIAGADALGGWEWLAWVAPLLLVLLVPAVLGRLVSFGLRLLRRPPLERPLSWAGLGVAVGWAVLSWLLAGSHVWLLATGLGLPATPRTFVLLIAGYAVAWIAGFVVVFVPAGAGVREAVLLALLAGALPHAAVLLVVLLSRVLLTLVDLAFAGVGVLVRPARAR
ncbi:lysylphosphatidylglycerol synthase domain-containing protein [Xylanimonas sp. McL0601]|uniref:lysylphosphatidylglycerol synthase domain-containing protein n=1 Tax=Xylanimonas sp. McL0601 TaxID=3414739 RepID=UPI003CF93801